jgi:hypothetical protein
MATTTPVALSPVKGDPFLTHILSLLSSFNDDVTIQDILSYNLPLNTQQTAVLKAIALIHGKFKAQEDELSNSKHNKNNIRKDLNSFFPNVCSPPHFTALL